MRLILVRHGETIHNLKGIIQGQYDSILSDTGREQAKKVAKRLKDEKIDLIFSSDLQRAHITAKEINKFHDIEIILDKRLREQGRGIYENKKRGPLLEEIKRLDIEYREFKPKGGESWYDLQQRTYEFFEELKKLKIDNILVTFHGGPMTAIILKLLNESEDEFKKYHPKNTAITIFDLNDKINPKLELLNCTKHLE